MQELEQIREPLTAVMRDVFDDESLVIHPEMCASEVENWDSLTHLALIVAVEQKFKVRFTTGEVTSLKNIGGLATLIHKKRASQS